VAARGYARHHLKNVCVFWGVVALLCLLSGGGFFLAGSWKGYAPAGYTVIIAVFLISAYMGGPALADLLGQPIPYECQIAGKRASIFGYKLFFFEERYYLRIERGKDHRPLALGTGLELSEGWFLAGKGYHRILSVGDRVRGKVYLRTRLIASLVKVSGAA
jgi:hypothetical protein